MTKISVALGTYNGAKFLSAQLESLLAQTRQPDELVIGDDGSNDETLEIIENFSQRAGFPIRLEINEKNLGSTKNFERIICRCEGDLIFLADQDDVWAREKIARIESEFLKKPHIEMIFSNAELVDENLQTLGKFLFELTFSKSEQKKTRTNSFFEVLLWQNAVTGATAAFRAGLRESFLPMPDAIPNLIHDAWIALVFAARDAIDFIDEPLIKYRQHANQQLGLNLKQFQKPDFEERRNSYKHSIRFVRNEIERLRRLPKIFKAYPAFSERKSEIAVLTAKFIKRKQQIITHYEARKNLPFSRWRRFSPIAHELSSGRYNLYSRGFLSAAKDLFQR